MDHMAPREGRVRDEQGLAMQSQELEIEELQRARIPEDGPAHRRRHEADDCIPFALLVPIGQAETHHRVVVGDRWSPDRPGFARRCVSQIDSEVWGEVGRQERVIGPGIRGRGEGPCSGRPTDLDGYQRAMSDKDASERIDRPACR
jgi:hypothetical protein